MTFRPVQITAALAVIAGVYALDVMTGHWVGLSLLYVMPIAWIAWRLGQGAGALVAVAGAIAWLAAELPEAGPEHLGATLWNGCTRLIMYQGTAFLVARARSMQAALQEANDRLREALAAAEKRAETDELTGLPNSRAFTRRLNEEVQRSARTRAPFAVAYVDLDRFKQVNDRFGHDGGDAALARIAQELRAIVRTEDVCARLGGDEFGILFVEAPLADAEVAARRLIEGIGRVARDYPGTGLSASVGIVGGDATSGDVRGLIHAADELMYRAKAEGRGTVRVRDLREDPPGPVERRA